MPYMIETWDRPGVAGLRAATRPRHVEYLKANMATLLAAGAKLLDDPTATGSFYLVATEDRNVAQGFADGDPFMQAGVFDRCVVTKWRKAFFNFENLMPADWAAADRREGEADA